MTTITIPSRWRIMRPSEIFLTIGIGKAKFCGRTWELSCTTTMGSLIVTTDTPHPEDPSSKARYILDLQAATLDLIDKLVPEEERKSDNVKG